MTDYSELLNEECTDIPHEQDVLHRLNQFAFYFNRALEDQITLYLDILEGKPNPSSKSSSLVGKAASGGAGAIPFVGKGASIAAQEVDKFILGKFEKKDAKSFADWVYSYRDDKTAIKKLIVSAAVELFTSFELQFMEVNTTGGKTRAMQKLADDAAHRVVTYYLENSITDEMSIENIIAGVLNGYSKGKALGLFKTGRTLKTNTGKEWKTSKIFNNVGICLVKGDEIKYFKNDKTKTEKHGHRLPFSFEDKEEIETSWEKDISAQQYDYVLILKDKQTLVDDVWKYVLKQYPIEELKITSDENHEEIIQKIDHTHKDIIDRQKELAEESKNTQESIFSKTVDIINESSSSQTHEAKVLFREACKDRQDVLEKTIEFLNQLHEIATDDRKMNTDILSTEINTIKQEIVETKMEVSESSKKFIEDADNLKNAIEEIKQQDDGAVVIKFDKNHPDVKNVRKTIKKIDKVLVDNDPSRFKDPDHPDVKNVTEAIKKVDQVLVDNDPSKLKNNYEVQRITKEIGRISDNLANAEEAVRKFFKW